MVVNSLAMVSPMASGSSERIADAERVLVIFPGALGDLVCLVPALRALARRHHDATLDLMAREDLGRFIVDRIGLTRGDSRSYSIGRREVAALFAESPDITTSAVQFFRPFTRIYSFFASDDARFRRALEAAAAPGAVSFHAFRPAGAGHVAAGYLDEIGERDPPLDEHPDAHIEALTGDIAEARQALARLGLADARVALLFPGSGGAHKNWPAENFAALASALAPQTRALVVFGPAERAIEPVLIPLLTAREIAWVRDLPLSTIVGLAHIAAGFVGNDSGVSHLVAAAGAPGVAIFGPTDPDRWRPIGRVIVIQALPLTDLTPAAVAAGMQEITGVP
jgi:hypothetical protein